MECSRAGDGDDLPSVFEPSTRAIPEAWRGQYRLVVRQYNGLTQGNRSKAKALPAATYVKMAEETRAWHH